MKNDGNRTDSTKRKLLSHINVFGQPLHIDGGDE